jgi:hypothetical protein
MSQNKRQTIEEFLIYFEKKGIEKGYFELCKIKELGKTCCLNAITQVIDFDKTKDKIVAKDGLKTPKSCDCLKIRPNQKCLDLIEMKGFAKFIEHFKGNEINQEINIQIVKHDLEGKIEDSLRLLDIIVLKKEMERTDKDVQFFRETKINYIVLTDIDSIDIANQAFNYIALNFIFYSQYSDSLENYITTKLKKELESIPNISHKLNKPMLKTCSEIDAYYLED